jgi:acetyl-CoA carboxylase carboxyltransferase component
MGGEQAAGVLTDIRRQALRKRGQEPDEAKLDAIRDEVLADYEEQASPYYATARLWDDGVIDPRQTRHVLGLALETTLNAPIAETHYGVLRI